MSISTPKSPRALVLGGTTGLLGQALVQALKGAGYWVESTSRSDIDPTNSEALASLVDRTSPDVIFNTLAYTQVDLAEDEPEQAMRVNRVLPCVLGRIVRDRPVYLVHFSTDFVFDGRKGAPYTPDDKPVPLSEYGRSKLAGEQALLGLALPNACIIRTAWLFGPGKKNFVRRIIELCKEKTCPEAVHNLDPHKNCLNVVHDQIGSPTYTPDLAAYTLKLVEKRPAGIFHIANSGKASWCELASEAVRLAQLECIVCPIPAKDYPCKACRPTYSVLDTSRFTELTGIVPRSWPKALADYIYKEFLPTE